MSISALHSGVSGIQQGFSSLRQNAHEIANANGGNGKDIASSMVGLIQDRNQVSANAEVIKTVDDTIGTLLDVMA